MYDIAMSALACLRAKTRADVVWVYGTNSFDIKVNESVSLFTPGGGKIGSIGNGVFDSQLSEIVNRKLSSGRRVELKPTSFEATLSQVDPETQCSVIVIAADQLPEEMWEYLLKRKPFALDIQFQSDEIKQVRFIDPAQLDPNGPEWRREYALSKNVVIEEKDSILAIFWPVKRLVIAGSGEIADALEKLGKALGWSTSCDPRPSNFAGLVTPLSENDAAVVMGHDVETSSECLAYALDSSVGYIGALGSQKMQANRADWLAYRNITDLSRIYGPAGLDIGASNPTEIALSICAQIIAFASSKL